MRDKVKRFISILMTALMLVNLMPVGALADGITSIGYKPEVAASTGYYMLTRVGYQGEWNIESFVGNVEAGLKNSMTVIKRLRKGV